jgi:hypothetical protein
MGTAATACLVAVAVVPAGAIAGLWGTGHWPYSNGIVCDTAGTSVPLVGWTLDGLTQPGYLTNGISETDGADSGRPPISGATSAADPILAAGVNGAKSAAQVAALAYLVGTSGASPDAATIAEVSEVVAEQLGQPTGRSCLQSGQGSTSAAAAATLWAQAQQLAGPYRVSLTTTAKNVVLDQPVPLTATVTSAAGQPVPGLAVQFASTGVGTGSTAVTDAAGSASAFITVDSAASIGSSQPLELTAEAATPQLLRVRSAPGATPAVYLDPSTTATTSIALPVTPPAGLSVEVALSAPVAVPGTTVTATVSSTGLNGHTAAATVSVAGPLPLDQNGYCRRLTAADWAAAIGQQPQLVVARATVEFGQPGAANTTTFIAGGVGCYSASVTLMTTDAASAQTAQLPYGTPAGGVTVVPITVTVRAAPGGVATGATMAPIVSITGAGSTTGVITGNLLGPVAPDTGACSTSWTHVAAAGRVQRTVLDGDASYPLHIVPTQSLGCYALELTIKISVAGLGSVTITPPPGSTGTVVLVVAPMLQISAASSWVDTGMPWTPSILLSGSLTQPGMITSQLLWLPAAPLGCASGDWQRATPLGSGQSVPTVGDGNYPLASAAPDRVGCYSLQVTLTLTANNAARSLTSPGSLDSLFLAVSPAAATALITTSTHRDDGLRLWVALLAATMVIGVGVVSAAGARLRPTRRTAIERAARRRPRAQSGAY